MVPTVFLTGFPGFIATRLLRRLASTSMRFLLLVQPAFLRAAADEIQKLARQTGKSLDDFRLITGDITCPDLGMSLEDLRAVRSDTTIIFHLAAIYDLAVSLELALQVNLEGTRRVNQLARTVKSLKHYHYVSTCYVAGKREGVILETELEHQFGFRNYYEQTKYLAEGEVKALKTELPVTIHRPSVVCGDSDTGETSKYDGVYYLIYYLLKWPGLLSRFNIGNDQVALNLVPVDFVVESLAALASDQNAVGKTIALADPQPLTTRALFDRIAASLCGHGSAITIPPGMVYFTLMLPLSPKITGLPHYGVPYFFLKQSYDTSEAQVLLKPHGLACPPFASYVDRIVAFATSHPPGKTTPLNPPAKLSIAGS